MGMYQVQIQVEVFMLSISGNVHVCIHQISACACTCIHTYTQTCWAPCTTATGNAAARYCDVAAAWSAHFPWRGKCPTPRLHMNRIMKGRLRIPSLSGDHYKLICVCLRVLACIHTCTWVSVCQERVRYVCHDKWIWMCSRMLKCMHTHAHCVCVCAHAYTFVWVCACTRMHIVWVCVFVRVSYMWEYACLNKSLYTMYTHIFACIDTDMQAAAIFGRSPSTLSHTHACPTVGEYVQG